MYIKKSKKLNGELDGIELEQLQCERGTNRKTKGISEVLEKHQLDEV